MPTIRRAAGHPGRAVDYRIAPADPFPLPHLPLTRELTQPVGVGASLRLAKCGSNVDQLVETVGVTPDPRSDGASASTVNCTRQCDSTRQLRERIRPDSERDMGSSPHAARG